MTHYPDEIEEDANQLLKLTMQSLFKAANLKLRPPQDRHKEKGIDITFEIETREEIPVSILWFDLQNKGSTSKITRIKKGPNRDKISYQLKDIRQIDYFCRQIELPFILTLCDLSSKTIYWKALQLEAEHYLSQIHEILASFQNKKRKGKSIQVYFNPEQTLLLNGEPCTDNFDSFLKDLNDSKDYITTRNYLKYSYEKLESIEEIVIDRGMPLLDQLYTYLVKRFENISVLPHWFWAQSYPFRTGKNLYFEFNEFTLFTDNSQLFEFFDSVRINDYHKLSFTDQKFINGVMDCEEKTTFVLRTLNDNLVFTIALQGGNKQKEVRYSNKNDLGNVAYYYANLQFDKILSQLDSSPKTNENIEENAFLQFEIGNYNESARLYLKLLGKECSMNKNSKQFIYAYNLSRLEIFVRFRYSNEPMDPTLHPKLNKIKNEFEFQTTSIPGDPQLTKWIKEGSFFWDFQNEIQQNVKKLRDFHFMIANGGLGSNSYISSIYTQHAMLICFLNGNRIVSHFLPELDHINDQFAESVIMSYSINPSFLSRLDAFDDYIIKVLLIYCEPESIIKYVGRYQVTSIRYAPNTYGDENFMDLARNYLSSAGNLKSEKGWDNSYLFIGRLRKVLSNILVLATYLKLSDTDCRNIAVNLRQFLNQPKALNIIEFKYLNHFLLNRAATLNESLFSDYFNLIFQSSAFHNEDYLFNLAQIAESANLKIEIDSDILEIINSYTNGKCSLCNQKHEPSLLISVYRLAKNESAKIFIREKIVGKLNYQFDWRLYYLSAVYQILAVNNAFFEELINYLPSAQGSFFQNQSSKEQNRRDFRLGCIINLGFMSNLDLTSPDFDRLRGFDPYYDWLMDMENFEYSNFNPKWITIFRTKYYARKMAETKKVMNAIASFLCKYEDPLVAKQYFKLLCLI